MDIFKNLMYMARRFKTATVLNLIGLTIAFAAFFLLMTQIDYSRSFNRALQDSERIYRLETFIRIATDTPEWIANTTRPVAEALDGLPEVEGVAITMPNGVSKVERDGQQWRARRTYISHNAMSVLTGEPVNGTLTFSDEDHSGCLISASMAQKFFGRTDVAGEMIKVDGKDQLVKGVYQNFPDNCNIHDAIFVDLGDMDKDNFGNYNFHTYVKIQSGVDTKALMERFSSTTKTLIVDAMYGMLSEADIEEIGVKDKLAEMLEQRFGSLECRLVPITETYFSGVDKEDDRGNAGILFILELASVLVLVVAAINFLNFALAESPIRIKGVNTRRVLGEGLVSLCLKLVGETIVMSLVACAMSLVAVWLLAQWPLVGDMFQGSIALSSHGSLIILLVAVACVVGLLAGIYPARFMTSFEPALALKGSFGLTPGGRKLRTGLVCLQLFVSSLMAIYIGILYLQSQYIYTSDYGFDKAEVVYADMSVPLMSKTETLRSQLLQLTGVESVSFSSSALATSDIMTTWGRDDHDHTAKFSVMFVDHYYLQTMGIPIVEGRDFNEHDQGCYVINQAARQKWTWVEMDKKLLTNDYPVVGVCQNVRFTSTRMSSDAPLAFFVPDEEYRAWGTDAQILNVRIAPPQGNRHPQSLWFFVARDIGSPIASLYNRDLRCLPHGCTCGLVFWHGVASVFCRTYPHLLVAFPIGSPPRRHCNIGYSCHPGLARSHGESY